MKENVFIIIQVWYYNILLFIFFKYRLENLVKLFDVDRMVKLEEFFVGKIILGMINIVNELRCVSLFKLIGI